MRPAPAPRSRCRASFLALANLEGFRLRLKRSLADLIQWERVCRVGTADADGTPHVVPVCHVLADGRIYFGSGSDAKKVLNLRGNPRVALVFDLYSDAWGNLKGVMVQGMATFIEKGPRFRRLRALLYAKYPQYSAEAALEEADSVIVEVTPTRAFSWGLE
ncbi:MAG: pyridoxamine 5'-phosphate oxidase family protein [Candidatus Methylomirabilia bacterium]